MKTHTVTININFTDDQMQYLERHVKQQKTYRPGDNPLETIERQTYANVGEFLQDQFHSSIAHLVPQPLDGEAAKLQRMAEEAQKTARMAKVSMVQVSQAQISEVPEVPEDIGYSK